ncbi:hypothetical protein ANCDUO_11882 [Ancylostoma duodenale]|uniref:Uncharacterized protein n=1 Tax=Ancylostoma duodenale TaxID=51022 RepID=A0A0C2D754_9BILA|nr:hypothetical protein ANCDUO_11882 [Ancylostoma duodenale]
MIQALRNKRPQELCDGVEADKRGTQHCDLNSGGMGHGLSIARAPETSQRKCGRYPRRSPCQQPTMTFFTEPVLPTADNNML